jgi:hypothetical protein
MMIPPPGSAIVLAHDNSTSHGVYHKRKCDGIYKPFPRGRKTGYIWKAIMVWGDGMSGLQSFIVEHLFEKEVDVYCGGPDVFSGYVTAVADNVLTLHKNGRHTHVNIKKIMAIWKK